jgi:hypothetical protein
MELDSDRDRRISARGARVDFPHDRCGEPPALVISRRSLTADAAVLGTSERRGTSDVDNEP